MEQKNSIEHGVQKNPSPEEETKVFFEFMDELGRELPSDYWDD